MNPALLPRVDLRLVLLAKPPLPFRHHACILRIRVRQWEAAAEAPRVLANISRIYLDNKPDSLFCDAANGPGAPAVEHWPASEIGRYRSACERLYRVEQTISRDGRPLFLARGNRARYVSVQLCSERQVRSLFVV